jgi:hypothetical protein
MSARTTETTVTFRRSFTLLAVEGAQPAAGRCRARQHALVRVSPDELAEAVASDAA